MGARERFGGLVAHESVYMTGAPIRAAIMARKLAPGTMELHNACGVCTCEPPNGFSARKEARSLEAA